ncbi:(3,5-dihydroxyphenyl)acetyl-CoA 1,2-dioxygenase DpgC [Streptomyces sp. NRRL S-481]|uniref:(3,5-dihydroxyphenyl)acetyl-CoA 1,2-dioxygenase DpgC n=1 Tax=Streptomyces sp. NRRL S-481 TaxID=1463911 RepID=UPI0004C9E56D|nr:(3,5-dihydroxyphenyl)acetyl-CoA 1,2-dioxygenase DpgC [Streptomyces sp. NRRL S-481]
MTAALTAAWQRPRALAVRAEEVLARTPRKADRTPEQWAHLDAATDDARRGRTTFLAEHGQAVYDALTGNRTRYLWLDELLDAAAELLGGLVPTREQMVAEAGLAQADKEGREIDQAVFFSGVLRHERAGLHLMESLLRPTDRALALLPEFTERGSVDLGRLHVERVGDAAHLTVTNPDALNAEDNDLIAAMDVGVDLALLDDRVKVGVLRGGEMTHPRYRGRRVFSAGINLRHLDAGRISYTDFLLRRELGYLSKLQRGLLPADASGNPVMSRNAPWSTTTVQKPWIAAVDSFAIGGGMQLLFAFDRVIAASDAYFSLPAAQEGIIPGVANLRLPRIAGSRLARQVILSGRRLHATEPEARLICDTIVDAADPAAPEAPAVVANRRMLGLAEEPPTVLRAYLAEFALHQGLRLYAPDVLEKTTKFGGTTS